MSFKFRCQSSVEVFGNLGRKVPVVDNVLASHEQEIYPTTPLDVNCVEFESQWHRKYYVDSRQTYLAMKLKFVKGCGYETYNTEEVKKEHKQVEKPHEETAKDQEAAFLSFFKQTTFCTQCFLILR